MGFTKKGYVTFVIFSFLSLALLMPLFFGADSPPASLTPAFAYQKTFSSHLAQKRALQSSASESYSQLKPIFSLLQAAQARGEVISISPPGMVMALSSNTLTHTEKESAARALIIKNWAGIASQWGKNSGQEMAVYCTGPPPPGLPDPAPPTTELFSAGSISGDCESQITLREDYAANNTALILKPGVFVLTTDAASNETALTSLQSFEVD